VVAESYVRGPESKLVLFFRKAAKVIEYGLRLVQYAARIVAWLLAAIITVLSLVPPELRPQTSAPHNIEHFAIFAAAGLAFGLGYSRRLAVVLPGLLTFAGAIELAQILVPGRHARLSDFIVDAVAMCGSAAVCSIGARTITQEV
jgi:VanZ family protein